MNTFPSRLLENAVNELARLPGIGRKSALRMALFLLKLTPEEVEIFGTSLIKMRQEIHFCSRCRNISDEELCAICANPKRDSTRICVVEDVRDVMAIENTDQYNGLYHVLGGVISPMEGIGPDDLQIVSLVNRLDSDNLRELILALPTTIEGDTTNFYIFKKVAPFGIPVTMIARGISVGDELEYIDEVTLGRSILHRIPYDGVK